MCVYLTYNHVYALYDYSIMLRTVILILCIQTKLNSI